MLNILRNIACNEASDIDLVVRGIGEARLFSLIEESLHTTRQDMLLHVCSQLAFLNGTLADGDDVGLAGPVSRLQHSDGNGNPQIGHNEQAWNHSSCP